eukprot:15463757-Alexandrium_andersonii.AAC.1
MVHGPGELAGAIVYPVSTQAHTGHRCTVPSVANNILVAGVQPALLQAVEEALARSSHLRSAKPAARLVLGQGRQDGPARATPVRLPNPGTG